ncbi:MAG TPA: MarR family winged helix-turn-helix transcriptional regulator [Steroidobacteraceae bacterium]|nr:MarR family winged helix-turn-helix transcriptional regulator [Steroidobacteraceae bacterium]
MPNSVPKRRLRLQNYLPYRLSVAANAVSQLIARAYQDRFHLKIPQWRLIAVLADEGSLTPQALCRRTVMDKVTVTRAAQGLLARRLVRRVPNADDRRSHRLVLTGAGRRLHGEIAPLALRYESHLLGKIQPLDVVKLERQLRQLESVAAELSGRGYTL